MRRLKDIPEIAQLCHLWDDHTGGNVPSQKFDKKANFSRRREKILPKIPYLRNHAPQ